MDEKAFIQYLNSSINRAEALLLDACVSICEKAVTEAKDKGKYANRSGVLRSSLGYCVAYNGRVYKTGGFETILNGTEGVVAGRQLAEKLARESSGIVAFVVAGAKYAVYVNAKGYDVKDSAEILAETITPNMLRSIGFIVL